MCLFRQSIVISWITNLLSRRMRQGVLPGMQGNRSPPASQPIDPRSLWGPQPIARLSPPSWKHSTPCHGSTRTVWCRCKWKPVKQQGKDLWNHAQLSNLWCMSRFWHCHENGLIKTIQTIPHNLYVSFKSASLNSGINITYHFDFETLSTHIEPISMAGPKQILTEFDILPDMCVLLELVVPAAWLIHWQSPSCPGGRLHLLHPSHRLLRCQWSPPLPQLGDWKKSCLFSYASSPSQLSGGPYVPRVSQMLFCY